MTGYLGPDGSYSSVAARKLTDDELVPFKNFRDLMYACHNGEVDAIVFPIENSVEGAVSECIDLLTNEVNLFVEKELLLPICHRLYSLEGIKWEDVTDVYTHAQAAAQCRHFIEENFPRATVHFTNSTSSAISKVTDMNSVAIAGEQVTSSLKMWPVDIMDYAQNATRFFLARNAFHPVSGTKKFSVIFEIENRPGGLLRALNIFEKYDLNLTKIESRPKKSEYGRYNFLVDVEGDCMEENSKAAIEELKEHSSFFKFIGAY